MRASNGISRDELINQIKKKQSFLCVGLDTDLDKIPAHLRNSDDPIFEFNKAIIDATKDLCVAYKPNLAFYECHGSKGWDALKRTVEYIPSEHLVIADAKRGDIGNTSRYYAKTFFEDLNCDAVTVAPYMGNDSVTPFFEFKNRWVILLALTSNEGALDFQFQTLDQSKKQLWQKVISRSSEWGSPENMMYVVGATRPEMLEKVRKLAPDHFLLVPGVGAQGGSLQKVAEHGLNSDCGLLINSSRGIIYAGNDENFAESARQAASDLQEQMASLLEMHLSTI